jgi:two-component system, OmpR family, response regulator RpaA
MDLANILVIEDDDIVARTIERSLRGEEFRVDLTSSGVEGLKAARRNRPDLIILDVIMPGMDGYAVCREIRADPVLTIIPVLFLTAKIKDEDKITGFNAGADDYLCKPFNIDELILRVRAILRRTQRQASAPAPAGTTVKVGDYTLDTATFELQTPHRGKVRLTPVQYDLLYHLMSHPGQIYSPMRLLNEVWDYPTDTGSPDLVRVHVKNLRELVELDPRTPTFIRTVPGYGYTVTTDPA